MCQAGDHYGLQPVFQGIIPGLKPLFPD